MLDMGKVFRKLAVYFTIVVVPGSIQTISAGEVIDESNCMQHLGGGGFGDFDCYERQAKLLDADNVKTANAIKTARGTTDTSKTELDRYMRTQDQAVKSCDLAVKLAYDWKIESPPKTHIDMYDVIGARCHYSLRKQQNDFLHDLHSIKTG